MLFFSATVLDHRLTELRWFEEGGMFRAFSNIDFQYFSGMGEIETADSIYTLMLALDTGTAEMLAERPAHSRKWRCSRTTAPPGCWPKAPARRARR